MTLRMLLTLVACALLLTACPPAEEADEAPAETEAVEQAPPPAAPTTATAVLTPRADQEGLSGTVTFTAEADGVSIVAHIEGASSGDHGFHIHEVGDCSADDFTSSGGHFNPAGVDHAGPADEERHAGDLGNITIGEDGTGHLEVATNLITLGEGDNSVIGRAVVLHEGTDDLTSQPTGAAGGRIGCGVIQLDGADAAADEAEADGAEGGEGEATEGGEGEGGETMEGEATSEDDGASQG